MPEGDTIHRVANALARRLVGARLGRVEMERGARPALQGGVVGSSQPLA